MNLNPIDFNYIDGENIYPIQEYIDEEIYNKIEYNNLYNTHSSNVRLNNNQKLDKSLYYSNASNLNNQTSHLILSNNFNFGEIKFQTFFKYANNNQIGTKIDYTGKLMLYHNYNLLQPTILEGYYDIDYELAQLKADGVATDFQLTGIEGAIITITGDVTAINEQLLLINNAVLILEESVSLIQEEIEFIAGELPQRAQILTNAQDAGELLSDFGNFLIRDRDIIGNSINKGLQFGVGAVGLTAIGAIFGFLYNDRMSNMANNLNSSNFQITEGDRSNLIYQADSQNFLYANDYILGTSNLNIFQGFINSNIITTQYINSINTNELKLNNLNISNIFVSSNVASNTSYGFSNNIFSSSNLNFNYTSNSLFSNSQPIYSSSNAVKDIILLDTPRVNKKSAFYCQTTNVIYPNFGNTPYYAYHIDLRNYTQSGYIQIGSQSGDAYRIFNIKCFFGSSYFQRLINGIPDIVDYTIYMSYKASSAGGDTKQGLNILATGIPQSYYLDTITPNRIFLLRNVSNDFNYISVVTTSSADVRIFIEDLLS
jgi:hypothetical protein